MNDTVTETTPEIPKTKPSTPVETVTMSDGRQVDFAGKKKLIKDSVITAEGVVVRLDFRNGETRSFTIPSDLLHQFAAHGAEQKLGDAIAGYKDEEIDDAILDVDSLIERLNKGEWNVKREGGGMAGTSVLLKALVEYSGKSVEQIKTFLKDKNMAEKQALRNSAKLKPIVERLEAEKANKGAKVDTDALLGSLG